ncbi:MAG: hypothetical protein K9W45_02220 [Candidatus Heimdallarchaeum aukensis]|uniref:Uncharacterized protein n=1 Tax=Candidatus Heimdallarchaeum aukensis TaxID=2876573 RepID=A0A9Y1BLJ7_9ARCH|nr:MAG: hypothetical protein K9W45_02220 [Candidatus Heimdallarchaeum aukensis]
MKKKIIIGIAITSLIIIGLTISFIVILYPKPPNNNSDGKKTHSYLYPNYLFANGTYTDFVVENDSYIHFVITSANNSCPGAVYGQLNLKESYFDYFPIIKTTFLDFLEVNIILNVQNKPITYLYYRDSFFDYRSSVMELRGTRAWEIYEPFRELPVHLRMDTMLSLLNWYYNDEGNLSMAYLYRYIEEKGTIPAIYREKNHSWFFLNNTFPEVRSYSTYDPGDFKERGENVFILWENHLDYDSSYPLLAVKWKVEGWKLYSLGTAENNYLPIALFLTDEYCDIFSYDPGLFSNSGKILRTRLFNASYFETKVIKEFDQRLRFYDRSMIACKDNSYIFIYTKKELTSSDDYDLFMGLYDGKSYVERQLTSSPDIDEYIPVIKLGDEYLHYCWMATPWDENEIVDRQNTKIYYNRTLLTDLFENETANTKFSLYINPDKDCSYIKFQYSVLFCSSLTRSLSLVEQLMCLHYLLFSKKG